MALGKTDVAHIARLARIRVADEELENLAGELDHILTWVEQLDEVDTAEVAAMTSVVETALKQRRDEVTAGGHPDEIVNNAPAERNDFFTVPKVVE